MDAYAVWLRELESALKGKALVSFHGKGWV